jgi:hypothetical protein
MRKSIGHSVIAFFLTCVPLFLAGASLASTGPEEKEPKSRFAQSRPSGDEKAKPEAQTAEEQKTNFEITVTAPRVEIPLKSNPAATTVVETPILQYMPRKIAIDEAMKLVPGVKVDN